MVSIVTCEVDLRALAQLLAQFRLDSALSFLRRYRYLILALMVTASLISVFTRFRKDCHNFWGMLLGHSSFRQAVFAYCRGSTITIGPGSPGRNANPLGRGALAAVAPFSTCCFSLTMATSVPVRFTRDGLLTGRCQPVKSSGVRQSNNHLLPVDLKYEYIF